MTHLTNLSMNMIPLVPVPMPTSSSNDKEITFKTIPSASKPEIKHFLQCFYGLEVQKVRTLNMKGKNKHRGGSYVAKPEYKKAYVTLKKPLSISHNLYPSRSTDIKESESNKVLAMQS